MMQPAMANNTNWAKLKCAAKVMHSYSSTSRKCYIAAMKEHCSNSKAARNSFNPRYIHHCPYIKKSLQQAGSLKNIKWKKSVNIIASCLGLVGQKKKLKQAYNKKCGQ